MALGIVFLVLVEVISVRPLIAPLASQHNEETFEGLAKRVGDLEAVVQKQTTQILNITNQLALLTKHTDTAISFTAFLRTPRKYPPKSPIKFDDVKNNIGGGYNQCSGVFRAPVSGMYMFTLALESESAGIADYRIMKQGQEMNYLSIAETYVKGTDTSIFHVNVGDDVSVDCAVSNGSPTLRGGVFSFFSGYLLRAD
ncbi:complement C1q-like protein 4 [Haliotis rufescens]|uniref:complement C1q-like protein 4 n=1 Tax=Haliotis rufescens TaxID=6454 RepID=UPI00201EA6B8|nr:complement C1q-like protein 4 [Haliotis rufescens]